MDRYNLDSENNLWMVYDAEKTKFRIRVQLESGHDGTECHQRGPFREKKTPLLLPRMSFDSGRQPKWYQIERERERERETGRALL